MGVERIEEVRTNFEFQALRDFGVLCEREVEVFEVRPAQAADPRTGARVVRGLEDGNGLESMDVEQWALSGIVAVWILKERINSRQESGDASRTEGARDIASAAAEEHGSTAGVMDDRAELPSTDHGVQSTAVMEILLSSAEGQIVDKNRRGHLRHIIRGQAAAAFRIEGRDRAVGAAPSSERLDVSRGIGNQLRIGIGEKHVDSVAETAFGAELEGVIDRTPVAFVEQLLRNPPG